MKAYWEAFVAKVDGFSLRERILIFGAVAFALVSLINSLFLEQLLNQQKQLSSQVVQQQAKMQENRTKLDLLMKSKKEDERAPLRERIRQLRDQIAQGDEFLKAAQDRLAPPDKIAALLEQVLGQNTRLQLVALETLPVALFIEPSANAAAKIAVPDEQIYKHGVRITVRGSYADLLHYLTALENLPTRMFWGTAKMDATHYPQLDLTLTLYTLSLDKAWLQI